MALDDIPVANEMRVAILCLLAIMAVSSHQRIRADYCHDKPAPAFCFVDQVTNQANRCSRSQKGRYARMD